MKVILSTAFLACLALVYTQNVIEIKCPEKNEENATFVPNPFNCSSYFACESGEPIPMKCPEGLHFNSDLSVCDWPKNANCKPMKP